MSRIVKPEWCNDPARREGHGAARARAPVAHAAESWHITAAAPPHVGA